MPRGTATAPSQHDNNTIILPISQDQYDKIVPSPEKMRSWIDEMYHQHPEIFPVGFERGYRLHDDRTRCQARHPAAMHYPARREALDRPAVLRHALHDPIVSTQLLIHYRQTKGYW